MTTIAKPLILAHQAANAETPEYTTPAGVRTCIDKFTATNTTASAATLTVKLIPSGGSAGAANQIVSKSLAAGECYAFPELVGHWLESGGVISVLAGTASAITIRASGREVT